MPCREHLLRAAREILHDDVLYDPEDWHMHIREDDSFRFNVSLGLWQIALQEAVCERRRRFYF
jgi:dihydroorotase